MKAASLFDNRWRDEVYQTGRLRRSTLVSLRWLAIAGQTVSVLFVFFILKMRFPVLPVMALIALSVFVNIAILAGAPLDRRISNQEAGGQLFYDVLQLFALIYLVGGLQNPFAILLMVPVVVVAKTLDRLVFGLLAGTVALLSLLLLFHHFPLPWFDGETLQLPPLYQAGMWLALQVGMLFTSTYTWRTTAQTKRMTEALATTDAILAHETKLSALGGMAAAAAHKLGTPLSTIQLVAREISNSAEEGSELAEDSNLIISESQTCRDILMELSQRGDQGDMVHDQLSLEELIREITEPFVGFGKKIITDLSSENPDDKMPILPRRPEFVYGLTNIVENAADFAESTVEVKCSWTPERISLSVIDDGPGFSTGVLDKVGEPYISYRPQVGHSTKKQTGGGLGLGVFIATTLIERVGGSISFTNRKQGTGAVVQMCWPREKVPPPENSAGKTTSWRWGRGKDS